MAELTINTEDIASAIRKNLEGFEPEVASGQVGALLKSETASHAYPDSLMRQ